MEFINLFYPESKFGGFTDIDGTIAFYTRVNSLIKRESTVLDFGCGRGAYKDDSIQVRKNLRILKGKVKRVIGIDADKASRKNPFIDKFYLIKGDQWPIANKSIDLIICDSVLEHIERPETFFLQANRVLKKGGYLCIRTPNSWSYVGIISRLIPNKYHSEVTAIAQKERKEEDVFPTFYRCNSTSRVRRMMNKYDFDSTVYGYEAEPAYLSFSKIAYAFGVLHQKIAPRWFKLVLFAFGRKTH